MWIIILLLIAIYAIAVIREFAVSILTLSFLPGALNIYDGNMTSYTIQSLGQL